jgi:predicted esterase
MFVLYYLEGADQRGWWFCSEDKKFSGKTFCEQSFGFEESLQLVEETFKTQGPFDGLLGFSQGASLTALIAAHSQLNPGLHVTKTVIFVN